MKKFSLYKLCLLSMILCYPNINHTSCNSYDDYFYTNYTARELPPQGDGPYQYYDAPSDNNSVDNKESPQPEIVEKYKNHHPANFANLVLHVKQPKKFPLNKTD